MMHDALRKEHDGLKAAHKALKERVKDLEDEDEDAAPGNPSGNGKQAVLDLNQLFSVLVQPEKQ